MLALSQFLLLQDYIAYCSIYSWQLEDTMDIDSANHGIDLFQLLLLLTDKYL